MGTLREGRFIPLPVDGNDVKNNFYDNPTSVPPLFRSVASDTVAVAGTSVRAESAACIENMEGAGFFAVCGALGVPFAELSLHIELYRRGARPLADCGGGRKACGGCREVHRRRAGAVVGSCRTDGPSSGRRNEDSVIDSWTYEIIACHFAVSERHVHVRCHAQRTHRYRRVGVRGRLQGYRGA